MGKAPQWMEEVVEGRLRWDPLYLDAFPQGGGRLRRKGGEEELKQRRIEC